ncbi:MAG: DNA-binding CsgD family transcriptional regulator [Bradymonadia bacterium]
MTLDSISDARELLEESLYATMRAGAATAVVAIGLHARRRENGAPLQVLGADVCASEKHWESLLPCAELSLPALMREEAVWQPTEKSSLPNQWISTLRALGIVSVALIAVQSAEGLSGLVLYLTRQRRQRSAVDITGGQASGALNNLRHVLSTHLTPPCMLVWGHGNMLGASRSARRWVDVFDYDFATAGRSCATAAPDSAEQRSIELAGLVVLESVALVGSAHFVTNLDVATAVPLVAAVSLAKRLREAATLGARGASVPVIAEEMGISPQTVRGYLKEVYRELGVANRVELARSLAPIL